MKRLIIIFGLIIYLNCNLYSNYQSFGAAGIGPFKIFGDHNLQIFNQDNKFILHKSGYELQFDLTIQNFDKDVKTSIGFPVIISLNDIKKTSTLSQYPSLTIKISFKM